jgi:hypothetical protein
MLTRLSSRALRVGLEAPYCLRGFPARDAAYGARGAATGRQDPSSSVAMWRPGLLHRQGRSRHLSRAIVLDQAHAPHPARVVSLAPGVIDTDMQVHLRGSDAGRFPDRERFVALQASGQLDAPATAAAKVLAYLQRSDFGDKPVADVRDA